MPSRPVFLRFALGFALLGAALWGAREWRRSARHPFVAPLATAPIFADEFDGVSPNPLTKSRLNPLLWRVQGSDQILQRTQWGRAPALLSDEDGTRFARLSLSTFNPNPEKAGRFHLSTQITSLDEWKLENGLEYEARLRADHLPPGLILGFFAYGDEGVWKKTYQKTESDFELLTVQGGSKVWTHIWDNWNPLRKGEDDGSMRDLRGANWNDGSWNTFKIRWYPDRTQWICNDILLREERAVRPGSPMGVWFNLWAPNPDWLDAYDPAIQAAPTGALTRKYSYDVDYVRVRRIPAAPRLDDQAAEIGRGEGLKGEYFSTPDLTGKPLLRLDPRVDFDWGRYPPLSALPPDGFSVRWRGFIQARHSQTYTFRVQTDDGARLWIDGRLTLDNWRVQGPAPRQCQIALRAGERVPIRLEMFNRSGDARAQLVWSSASTPPEIVPQSQLYAPSRPAAPRFAPDSKPLQGATAIQIHTSTPDAIVRYTLDGTPPTWSSQVLEKGAALRVSYSTLVRAGAFVAGEVPSETARALYLLDDKTPPAVILDALPPRAVGPGRVAGRVFDGGSGVARVDLVITRLSDGLRWKQGNWVNQEWGMEAKLRAGTWSVSAGLPPQQAWKAGEYEFKAVAYDDAGNITGARQSVLIGESAMENALRPKSRQ